MEKVIQLNGYSLDAMQLLCGPHDENIALQADRIITIEDGGITRDEVIRG